MIITLLTIVGTVIFAVIFSYIIVNHFIFNSSGIQSSTYSQTKQNDDVGDGDDGDTEHDIEDANIEKYLTEISKPSKLKSQKRRIVVSKEVDRYIEKIIESFIDYYIITWYRPLIVGQPPIDDQSNSDASTREDDDLSRQSLQSVEKLRQVLKNNLWSILSTLIDRLYSVNYVNFVAISLINRVSKHLTVLNHHNGNPTNGNSNNSGSNSGRKYSTSNISSSANSVSSLFSAASSSNSSLAANSNYESVPSLTQLATSADNQILSDLLKHSSSFSSSSNHIDTKFRSNEEKNTAEEALSTNNTVFDQLIFNLSSHVASKKDENSLLHCLSSFLIETLLKTTIFDEKSTLENSTLLKQLLSDFMALFLKSIIEKVSDPCFINYQIIRLIEKHIIVKNLVFIEKLDSESRDEHLKQLLLSVDVASPNLPNESSLKYFSSNDMKLCIIDHNFPKLFELLDQCEDLECLRHIRLYIIGEILDAAVINYLNKNEIQSKRSFRMKTSNNANGSKLNPQTQMFFDRVANAFKPSNQRTSINSSGVADFGDQHDISGATARKHFAFNANINTKVKQLRTKDLRRYLNQLRYAKTICEQKIHILKRNSALLLSPGGGNLNNNTISDSFEISLSTEYIRALNSDSPSLLESHQPLNQNNSFQSFLTHSPNSPVSISDHLSFKPKSKKIFKYKVIMANDFSRSHFKRFLQNSLFNREHRSSWSKYRKDTLICECATYLVEFWEVIQTLFANVTNFYLSKSNNQTTTSSESQFATLHSLFSHSYLLILQIVTDSRFYYTFSSQFLQLPAHLLKRVENFLLGDIDLAALRQTSDDFMLQQFAIPVVFDNELLAGYCLDTIDWDKFLNIFIVLEKIIFKCLCDEFYPQFLISNEYDEMLFSDSIGSIEVDREISSTRWSTLAKELFKNSDRFDLLSKPINKVSLQNDQIDIGKNRSILLNSLEFPFLGLVCLQFICQRRLYVKVCIKDILTRYSCGEINQFCLDIGQLVNRDIVYYYDIYSRLHSVITNVYCWLHSDITCSVSNLNLRLHSQNGFSSSSSSSSSSSTSNFIENKFMSFVENIFPDSGHSSSSQSYSLFFHIHISTKPSKHLLFLPKQLQSELLSNWSSQWTVEQSIDELVQFFNRSIVPSIRLISYLHKYQLNDYMVILFRMMEQSVPLITDHDTSSRPKNVFKVEENSHYLDKLIKTLCRNITDIKRHLRIEIRDRQKREKLKHKYDQQLSFKKLLDNENVDKVSNESHSDINVTSRVNDVQSTSSSSNWFGSATPIESMSNILNYFLSQLATDPNISKMKGFLNFIKYEPKQSQTMDTLADPGLSSLSCLRCLLYDHVGDNNCDDLTKFILHSLCSISFNYGIDVPSLVSSHQSQSAPKMTNVNLNATETVEMPKSSNFFETLQFPIGTAASKLFHTSALPVIDGPNRSGQLFFLHSRSWLSEKTTPEILDYILSMFKYFDKFCPSCSEQLFSMKRFSNSVGPNNNNGSGDGPAGSRLSSRDQKRTKFRLFNLDTVDRAESSNCDDYSSSSRAFDVVNLKGSKCDLNSTTSSLLNETVDTNLFDDFSIEKFDLISSSLDDMDANLIEPLFQMLIEIFELKGTMTRTLRRTLMFGFQLVFGQAMLSKQLKTFLQSIFTDSNVLYFLSLLDSYINDLKSDDSTEKGNKYQSKAEKVGNSNNNNKEQDDENKSHSSNSDNGNEGNSRKSCYKKSAKLDSYLKDLDKLLDSIDLSKDGIKEAETVDDAFDETLTNNNNSGSTSKPTKKSSMDDPDPVKFRRLQILAKQLLFASVPTFLNHLFGQENALTGLNKCFDILQYQDLNKQLVYEFIEAFLLEYFPEFRKI